MANYETLFIPFDTWTWYGVIVCVAVELAVLIVVDWLYRRVRGEKAGFLFEGENMRVLVTYRPMSLLPVANLQV